MHSMNINKSMTKKVNVLILGATGFVGRNIAHLFSQNPNFSLTLTRFNSPEYRLGNAKWVRVDLRDPSQLENVINHTDILIQAAATTSGANDIVNTPEIHVTDNAVMNSLVLRAASNTKVKHVIFFSCTTMYQSNFNSKQSEEDFDENMEIFPQYFGVAVTKIYIEKLCEFYSKISDTKFTVIRHSNVYGPWDKYDLQKSHVMGATITKVLSNNEDIEIWGDGVELRDFLYIDDLVELVKICIEKQASKFLLINAGSDTGISIRDLVKLVIKLSEKQLQIKFNLDKPTLKFSFIADSSKALNLLGWKSTTPLEVGIAKSIDWWKKTYGDKIADIK